MPLVPAFTLRVRYDFTQPEVRAPAPRPKAKRSAKPKAKCPPSPGCPPRPKPKRKSASRPKLSPQCRSIMMDRIEAAIERGLIQHCPDEMPCEFLDFTTAELAKLYEILLPEEFFEPKKARRATRDTAPASPERIAVYAERQAAGQSITAAGDVGAVRRDGKQLRIAERKNGSGVRVVGWEE